MVLASTTAQRDQELDDLFAALANSTRRSILTALASGEASVNEVAEPFDMSLPAISRHLKVLERAGLVVRGRRAQYRPCALNPEPLDTVSDWAQHCRSTWQASFERLDTYLDQLQSNPKEDQ